MELSSEGKEVIHTTPYNQHHVDVANFFARQCVSLWVFPIESTGSHEAGCVQLLTQESWVFIVSYTMPDLAM
jgi:hypothetical protein